MKEFIKNQLKHIKTQKQQTQQLIEKSIADLNALVGAEQAYQEMLNKIKKEDTNDTVKDSEQPSGKV